MIDDTEFVVAVISRLRRP